MERWGLAEWQDYIYHIQVYWFAFWHVLLVLFLSSRMMEKVLSRYVMLPVAFHKPIHYVTHQELMRHTYYLIWEFQKIHDCKFHFVMKYVMWVETPSTFLRLYLWKFENCFLFVWLFIWWHKQGIKKYLKICFSIKNKVIYVGCISVHEAFVDWKIIFTILSLSYTVQGGGVLKIPRIDKCMLLFLNVKGHMEYYYGKSSPLVICPTPDEEIRTLCNL